MKVPLGERLLGLLKKAYKNLFKKSSKFSCGIVQVIFGEYFEVSIPGKVADFLCRINLL